MDKKFLVIGCCGAGKSTLAKKMQERTGLPLIHLDHEYYRPGWVKPKKAEWEEKVRQLCLKEAWIMDGNYTGSLEMRLGFADAVVFLDIGRVKCLLRAIGRVLRPSQRCREDMAEGCEERHDLEFYRFIWSFPNKVRPGILKVLEEQREKNVYILRSEKEIEGFLMELGKTEL